MHVDDRLATVLRRDPTESRGDGTLAVRTQYRQLLDLLGHRKPARGRQLAAQAWARLDALAALIPLTERARIVADCSAQLSSPELVANLANDEPGVAAAALQRARLSAEDWEALIPQLPVRARGFLRFRDDLPPDTVRLLDRLGVQDRGLPNPNAPLSLNITAPITVTAPAAQQPPCAVPPVRCPPANNEDPSAISVLVKRIEAFQKARVPGGNGAGCGGGANTQKGTGQCLPAGGRLLPAERTAIAAFDFTCDVAGRIDWAERTAAPMVEGTTLSDSAGVTLPVLDLRRPLKAVSIILSGAPAIAGQWQIDAAPRFLPTGSFSGYAGRFRRLVTDTAVPADDNDNSEAARIREILHELRTPINAIQGFAEVIQQQLFGPVPHDYRAHAASIAGDAARIMAAFDELDRLARLTGGTLELTAGECDFASLTRALLGQLQPVLAPLGSSFDADITEEMCMIALDRSEAEAIAWRLLATIARTVSADETVRLMLKCTGDSMQLKCELTNTLLGQDDVFTSTARPASGALSAGTFGAGFALRLARAEADAAGGDLIVADEYLTLSLPRLTLSGTAPSADEPRSAMGGLNQ